MFGFSLAQIRKALVCLVGVIGIVLTANLLPSGWDAWVSTAAAVLTFLATYAVPNAPTVPLNHTAPDAL